MLNGVEGYVLVVIYCAERFEVPTDIISSYHDSTGDTAATPAGTARLDACYPEQSKPLTAEPVAKFEPRLLRPLGVGVATAEKSIVS